MGCDYLNSVFNIFCLLTAIGHDGASVQVARGNVEKIFLGQGNRLVTRSSQTFVDGQARSFESGRATAPPMTRADVSIVIVLAACGLEGRFQISRIGIDEATDFCC